MYLVKVARSGFEPHENVNEELLMIKMIWFSESVLTLNSFYTLETVTSSYMPFGTSILVLKFNCQ